MEKSQSDLTSGARRRGYSDSKLKYMSSNPLNQVTPIGMVQLGTLAPAATVVPSSFLGDAVTLSSRQRSSPSARAFELARTGMPPGDIPPSGSGNPGFWWSPNRREVVARPWNDEEKNDSKVPGEQKENWEKTRKTVSRAVMNVLGEAAIVTHKTLVASMPLLELVPVPGLALTAKLLIKIWDAVQEVDTNRLAFLRLTERCACIVITLHQEMQDAGEDVTHELTGSLRRIEDLFTAIQTLVNKEGNIPFLKRYLKRDETLEKIKSLNRQLDQELQILGPSFQIRTVKVIKEFTAGMDERIEAVIQRALHNHCCSHTPTQSPALMSSPRTPSILGPTSTRLLKPLKEITGAQDDKDRELDRNDLKTQINAALHSGNDATMLEFLQVPREDILEAIKSMQRHLEHRKSDKQSATGTGLHDSKDTLDREFIETGIDSLRRMSKSSTSLPGWTITRFEIDCGSRIGVGFFSDVYEGMWRGQAVAVKVLRDFSSSRLFVREVEIWKSLDHPNVVELLGASSASGNPPWFFVSPFAKYGDLGNHLRHLNMAREQRGLGLMTSLSSSSAHTFEALRKERFRPSRECDLHRFLLEIAMGMDYLHSHGVFHGDLKCANILVNENYTCLISDFGQSEIRAEAYRMSGISANVGGTLRWQAPEVMQGQSDLTPAVDVYAYAISCVEVLTMGQMPWCLIDDNAVQFIVLKENGRPVVPSNYHATPVKNLLQDCWHQDARSRPSFSEVVLSLQEIRRSAGGIMETPPPLSIPEMPELEQYQELMSPISLSPCRECHRILLSTLASLDRRSLFAHQASFYAASPSPHATSEDGTIADSPSDIEHYASPPRTDSSSTLGGTFDILDPSEEFVQVDMDLEPKAWEAKNERRYRASLMHRYHSSLSVPLWQPVPVAIGAVGYLLKPSGSFVTLFNAIEPQKSPDPRIAGLPSIEGYGKISIGSHKHATRNAALRGLDAVVGLISSGKREETSAKRRASFPLRNGHTAAYMYTDSTEYRYLRKVEAAKAWFKANIDRIMENYGVGHDISRESLMLIVGVLEAPNYALFVSHEHPDGNVHFHALNSKLGQPWGMFTIDNKASNEHGGPLYHETPQKPHQCAYKASINGDPPKAVLLARLRFPPDQLEPTTQ
ncbi:hypothetical protein P691DRAFT_664706 [Macrolepiota fuliginosa MF-IS2]|uniref:Protein kinase domain-containing protein n=1 Tax=Macrolepiota fuliginosa MF-IS2 TaxID=1400762 RepID=A0A9P6C6D4_9AGAR|nr:hypothetical protein P691DRAFT_664706 [Macrolepiota fuliginosa MF-IS2]